MATAKKILVNPYRRKAATKKASRAKSQTPAKRRHKARKTNPGALSVLGPLNPQKKGTSNMKAKTRKKKTTAPRRRRNPAVSIARKTTTRRRRNPSIAARSIGTLKTGVIALLGLVITRQAPQMLLGARNTGIIGYVANFAAMLVSAAAISKVAGKPAGEAAGIGGALYIANRVLSENFSPIGKALSLSGVGDATAASPGQLGAVRPHTFFHPAVYDGQGRPQIPAAMKDYVGGQVSAARTPPSSQVSGHRFGRAA